MCSRRCRHGAHKAGPGQRLICAKVQVSPFRHMLVIVLQTSMTCSQEGKLAARLQNIKMCGRAHGPSSVPTCRQGDLGRDI